MSEEMTPIHAIRSAIMVLQRERMDHNRKPVESSAEVIEMINTEIAALEEATRQLKQYAALKEVLKAVVSE